MTTTEENETKLALRDITSNDLHYDFESAKDVPREIQDHIVNKDVNHFAGYDNYSVPMGMEDIAKNAKSNTNLDVGDIVYLLDSNGTADNEVGISDLVFWQAEVVKVSN